MSSVTKLNFSFLVMTSECSTTHRRRTNNTYLPDVEGLLPYNFDRSFNNMGIIDASGPAQTIIRDYGPQTRLEAVSWQRPIYRR